MSASHLDTAENATIDETDLTPKLQSLTFCVNENMRAFLEKNEAPPPEKDPTVALQLDQDTHKSLQQMPASHLDTAENATMDETDPTPTLQSLMNDAFLEKNKNEAPPPEKEPLRNISFSLDQHTHKSLQQMTASHEDYNPKSEDSDPAPKRRWITFPVNEHMHTFLEQPANPESLDNADDEDEPPPEYIAQSLGEVMRQGVRVLPITTQNGDQQMNGLGSKHIYQPLLSRQRGPEYEITQSYAKGQDQSQQMNAPASDHIYQPLLPHRLYSPPQQENEAPPPEKEPPVDPRNISFSLDQHIHKSLQQMPASHLDTEGDAKMDETDPTPKLQSLTFCVNENMRAFLEKNEAPPPEKEPPVDPRNISFSLDQHIHKSLQQMPASHLDTEGDAKMDETDPTPKLQSLTFCVNENMRAFLEKNEAPSPEKEPPVALRNISFSLDQHTHKSLQQMAASHEDYNPKSEDSDPAPKLRCLIFPVNEDMHAFLEQPANPENLDNADDEDEPPPPIPERLYLEQDDTHCESNEYVAQSLGEVMRQGVRVLPITTQNGDQQMNGLGSKHIYQPLLSRQCGPEYEITQSYAKGQDQSQQMNAPASDHIYQPLLPRRLYSPPQQENEAPPPKKEPPVDPRNISFSLDQHIHKSLQQMPTSYLDTEGDAKMDETDPTPKLQSLTFCVNENMRAFLEKNEAPPPEKEPPVALRNISFSLDQHTHKSLQQMAASHEDYNPDSDPTPKLRWLTFPVNEHMHTFLEQPANPESLDNADDEDEPPPPIPERLYLEQDDTHCESYEYVAQSLGEVMRQGVRVLPITTQNGDQQMNGLGSKHIYQPLLSRQRGPEYEITQSYAKGQDQSQQMNAPASDQIYQPLLPRRLYIAPQQENTGYQSLRVIK